MENEIITIEYATRPSLVAKRMGTKLKPEGNQLLAETESAQWVFDPERGSVLVLVSGNSLEPALREVEETLAHLKLPLYHEGTSLLTARVPAAGAQLMESVGFALNSNTKVWEWKGEFTRSSPNASEPEVKVTY